MKKIMMSSLCLTALWSPLTGLAADHNTQASVTQNQPPDKQQPQPQVLLYEKPELKSQVIAQLTATSRFIPFFQQRDWVKVGLPENGQVGWINIPQYTAARDEFYGSRTQIINNESIVVYKNGQKLNEAEAKKLYQQLQQRNQQQMDNFWRNQALMLHEFDDEWFSPPIFIIQTGPKTNTQNEKK